MQPFLLVNILILCVVFVILTIETLTGGTGFWRTISLGLTGVAVVLWIAGRVIRYKDKRAAQNESDRKN